MFTELKSLLDSCSSVSVILANGAGDTVNVTVIPKARDGQNAVLSTPLALSGTLAELDAEFERIVSGYTATRTTLAEQLEATETILEAEKENSAKKLAERKAKKSLPKPSSSTCCTGDDDDDNDDAGCKVPETTTPAASAPIDDLWA